MVDDVQKICSFFSQGPPWYIKRLQEHKPPVYVGKMWTKQGFLILLALWGASGLNLPPDFKRCRRSDGKLNECLAGAIQSALPLLTNGLPEFKFPPIQPVFIPSMTIGEGTGTVHVVQNFKNINLFNIAHAKIEKVDAILTEQKGTIIIDVFVDELKLEADYDMNGRVLVLPIVGNGKATIKLDSLKCKLTLNGEVFQKKGKDYLGLKSVKLEMEPDKVEFKFDNLFNGDERLGGEMHKVLNDNWREVYQDVRSGYEEALGLIIQNIANIIFKKVPYDELLPL